MIFFGSKRKRATEGATHSLQPLIYSTQRGGGMAGYMWQDPYILGYMVATATGFVLAETGGKLKSSDLKSALQAALSSVSGIKGSEIVRTARAYIGEADSKYDKGHHEGEIYSLALMGLTEDIENHPVVQKGRAHDNEGISCDPRAVLATGIMLETFSKRIKQLREQTPHA